MSCHFSADDMPALHQLELCHIVLPFRLAGQGGEACHGCVPLKVERRLHYHEQAGAQDVYLHLEDAYLAYALQYLFPGMLTVVPAAIFCYQFGIVAEVQCPGNSALQGPCIVVRDNR